MKKGRKIITKIFGVVFVLFGALIMASAVIMYSGGSRKADATVTSVSSNYALIWQDNADDTVKIKYNNTAGYKDGEVIQIDVDLKTGKFRVPTRDGMMKSILMGTILIFAGLSIMFLITGDKKGKKNKL